MKTDSSVIISHPAQLLRLRQVLQLVSVSRSTWLAGVKTGRFPAPVKNGRCVFWKAETILALLESMSTPAEV
jgi:prophage regulatory protein